MIKYFLFILFFFLGQIAFADEVITKEYNADAKKQQQPSSNVTDLQPVMQKVISVDERIVLAKDGDLESQLWLAYAYLYGENDVQLDYAQAFYYYELAANQNNAEALNNLGSLYFNGIGTKVNYNKAIEYFERAAENGSTDAALNLAIIFLGDKSFLKNETSKEKISALLHLAAKDNDAAKFLLGYAYYKGFIEEKNAKKAFELIKAAADAQYDEAQLLITNFYIDGIGTPKSYDKAISYLKLAVQQGSSEAMMQLADILSVGKITTVNLPEAYYLYNIASFMDVEEASEKRDDLEKKLQLPVVLEAQKRSEEYLAKPSDISSFVRRTFGKSLKIYIDNNMKQ